MTQPDIYIGFTPTLAAGHGNHQQAGRYIWEGIKAAADPTMFPEQLTGPERAQHLAGQEGLLRRPHRRHRRHDDRRRLHHRLPPRRDQLDTVAGVWTGYDSPYLWPAGNVQGRPAGTPKIWAQVASEGGSAYPTQSRVMNMGTSAAGLLALRHDQLLRAVPAQREPGRHGQRRRRQGRRDPLRRDVKPDPGGLPLGTLEYLTFSRFFNAPGAPFKATLHLKAPARATIPAGTVALNVPGRLDGRRGRQARRRRSARRRRDA